MDAAEAARAASRQLSGSARTTQPPNLQVGEPQSPAYMRRLWERMVEIFGHRWTSAYGDDAANGAGVTWAMGLAGITPAQLADGISAVMKSASEWPPSLPAFRAMCLSIPTLGVVRGQLNAEPRPPFVAVVVSYLDMYRFAHSDQASADRLLADAYANAREHVMAGGTQPVAPALDFDKEAAERRVYDAAHRKMMEDLIVERYGSREAWERELAKGPISDE